MEKMSSDVMPFATDHYAKNIYFRRPCIFIHKIHFLPVSFIFNNSSKCQVRTIFKQY